MEYARNKMKNMIQTINSEHNRHDEVTTIYQTMCVKQDFTNGINAGFYKNEELALEVV